MNHGQNKPNLQHSPVSQSQPTEEQSHASSGFKTDEKVRVITINTSSLTKGNVSAWTPQKMSRAENSWKLVHSSSPKQPSAPSCPILFWEVLMTVALLTMALWMQGLPARQMPHSTDSETLPSFELSQPPMQF